MYCYPMQVLESMYIAALCVWNNFESEKSMHGSVYSIVAILVEGELTNLEGGLTNLEGEIMYLRYNSSNISAF